ncbi:MAG TPA: hypothetical protein VFN60_13520 [Acidimicrobiales bacterium]|nr:hypothetical protein [Acidimicrobiales bacterium]
MTWSVAAEAAASPRPPAALEALVACLDEDRLDRIIGASGPCALALPRGWPDRPPGHVEVVPVDTLLGWDAPPDVDTLVFVGEGTASTAGAAARSLPPERGRTPTVRVVVAVDRAGHEAGRLRVGTTVEHRPPAGGRLLDALRRCLGLATPPPAASTAGLLAALWLGALADHHGAPRLGWAPTLRLHPAAGALEAHGHGGAGTEGLPDAALEEAIVAAPRVWTWDRLRVATAELGTLDLLCPAGLAGWMDEGMFARWVTGSTAAVAALTPAAQAATEPAAFRRLRALLARTGVDLPAAPGGS